MSNAEKEPALMAQLQPSSTHKSGWRGVQVHTHAAAPERTKTTKIKNAETKSAKA
jgi:hypothetical protein